MMSDTCRAPISACLQYIAEFNVNLEIYFNIIDLRLYFPSKTLVVDAE